MPWKTLAQLVAVAALGSAGGALGVPHLRVVASDVLTACSVLAAFLVQVMLLLATILNPGKLTPSLLREIAAELDLKQREAFVLFCFYVAALGGFLAIKMTNEWKPKGAFAIVQSHGLAAVASFALAFAVVRTVAFLSTMRHIQTLRHKLLHQDATVDQLKSSVQPAADLQHHNPAPESPPFGLPAKLD